MTREEFEIWVMENGVSEAIERLPEQDRSLKQWLKKFSKNLLEIAREDDDLEEEDSEELDEEEEDESGSLDEDD